MFKRFSRKRCLLAVGAALILFAAYSLQGEKGFVRLGEMLRERNELRERVRLAERENARLAEEVGRLRDDAAAIEEQARIRLDLVRPGEVVYVFPPETEDSRP